MVSGLMCGLIGIAGHSIAADDALSLRLLDLLKHRGPDHSLGVPLEDGWMGHTRLAVVDLSEHSNQPLVGDGDQTALVFNGEIYNFRELAERFQVSLDSQRSDTLLLWDLFRRVGVEKTLFYARGMFAFAFYEKNSKRLTLGRDQFGEKPLYWSKVGRGSVAFASELLPLKELLDSIGERVTLNRVAVDAYLALGYTPTPLTLLSNVSKLRPGHLLTFNTEDGSYVEKPLERQHYDVTSLSLRDLLSQAIAEQLQADVPVGTFLSGGLDSTTVTMLAREQRSELYTFSIGFELERFDESQWAQQAAHTLGTNHHAWVMTAQDAERVIGEVSASFADPLGDPSLLPTAFLSMKARESVTVALSGDGADELLFGYPRYRRFAELSKWDSAFFRSTASALIPVDGLLPARARRAVAALSSSPVDKYLHLVGYSPFLRGVVSHPLREWRQETHGWNFQKLRYEDLRDVDLKTYLCDDILPKVDRCAMAFSLETRAPFLDQRVVDWALHRNVGQEIDGRSGKASVRAILATRFPAEFIEREKQGFGAPVGEWLRTSLHRWRKELSQQTDWDALGLEQDAVEMLLALGGSAESAAFSTLMLANAIRTLRLS